MPRTSTPNLRPLLMLGLALAATPLAAKDPLIVKAQPLHQQRVSFADLDLREMRARMVLNRRVMDAAWAVCIAAEGLTSASRALGSSQNNCPNSTYDAARPQIAAAIRRAKAGQVPLAAAFVVSVPTATR